VVFICYYNERIIIIAIVWRMKLETARIHCFTFVSPAMIVTPASSGSGVAIKISAKMYMR